MRKHIKTCKNIDKNIKMVYNGNIEGGIMMDKEFDFSKYFEEDTGKEDKLDSETLSGIGIDGSAMTKDEIKKMFDSLGITYKESDINYFKNSLTTDVAPKVQNKIDEVVGQSTKDLKKINIDGVKNIFTNKTINSNKIVIVICAIIILILNYKNVSFLSIYAINSGLVCVVLKIFEVLINKINEMVPIEYASMVGTFINPLTNQFKKDFNMLIWIVIICVLLQLVMYILINKTEYGDKLSFLKYGNNKVSEEEQYKNMYDEFNSDFGTLADEMDFSQFDDNNTIASAYDSKELKDITFSTGVYVHNEHNK